MLQHKFLIGRMSNGILKAIRAIEAETTIEAKNIYKNKYASESNILCIGEIIDNITYITTSHLNYIDWDNALKKDLTLPIVCVNNLPCYDNKLFIVGLVTGGVMEDPDIRLDEFNIIQAASRREAEDKYNKINNCSYYYGRCIGEIVDTKTLLYTENIKDVDYINLDSLRKTINQI